MICNEPVEIIISEDGSIFVPRGNTDQNKITSEIIGSLTDNDELSDFFNSTEHIYGDTALCG